jgi:hypothetical protein
MSKLFIFGIGGTGSRVLRSLTMLLASGVKMGCDTIVPIIIDPDTSNADLTRTVSLLNNYSTLRAPLQFAGGNKNEFFKTWIEQVLPNYTLYVNDTNNKTFQQFIGYASMSKTNKAMTKMLFSDKNLESSMEVGFKGNPNIGSVVLNQIAQSDDFVDFANSFSEGDKIFIISSIFGGTGASGFPLLLKTLRCGNSFPNHEVINKAYIGAISILPYFKLKPDECSEIDSSTFISKTKSALAYYEENIIRGGSTVDALYYLADDVNNTYENNEGGSAQQNDAHMVEFFGATAIVDFSSSNYNRANLELGVKEAGGAVTFDSLYPRLRSMLFVPLTQFTMMTNALTEKENFYSSNTFNANNGNFEGFYSSSYYMELKSFIEKYRGWLEEMKGNTRSLDLFNINCKDKPFELVTGIKPKKILSIYSDYDLLTSSLNKAVKTNKSNGKEDKFLEMFYVGTEKLVSEKLCK